MNMHVHGNNAYPPTPAKMTMKKRVREREIERTPIPKTNTWWHIFSFIRTTDSMTVLSCSLHSVSHSIVHILNDCITYGQCNVYNMHINMLDTNTIYCCHPILSCYLL